MDGNFIHDIEETEPTDKAVRWLVAGVSFLIGLTVGVML